MACVKGGMHSPKHEQVNPGNIESYDVAALGAYRSPTPQWN